MELEDLKSNWQQAGQQTKNREELQQMTQVRNHPQLRRIILKLLIESMMLILFLTTYHDAFDGTEKPFWLNAVLTIATLLYIISDLTGFFLIRNKIKGVTLLGSLQKLLRSIQQVSVLSIVAAFIFGVTLIFFFSYNVVFNQTRYILISGAGIGLLMATWWSIRIWKNRLTQIKEMIGDQLR